MLLIAISRFWELFGVRRPMRYEKPVSAGDYEDAMNSGQSVTFLQQYLDSQPKSEPRLGGTPKEVAHSEE